MQHKIKAVIFDMDGVIINTSKLHETAWRIAGELHGLTWPDKIDFMRDVFGTISKDSARLIYGTLPPLLLEELMTSKDNVYEQGLYNDVANIVLPGFTEFLDFLKSNMIRVAVATSARKEEAHFVLKTLNILDKLEVVIDSSKISKAKPDPEAYLKVLDALNLKCTECIAFEDSLSGIKSVTAAGIQCILVKTTMDVEKLLDHNLNCIFSIDNFLPAETITIQNLFKNESAPLLTTNN
jgi:beta-phosphoglucomutase